MADRCGQIPVDFPRQAALDPWCQHRPHQLRLRCGLVLWGLAAWLIGGEHAEAAAGTARRRGGSRTTRRSLVKVALVAAVAPSTPPTTTPTTLLPTAPTAVPRALPTAGPGALGLVTRDSVLVAQPVKSSADAVRIRGLSLVRCFTVGRCDPKLGKMCLRRNSEALAQGSSICRSAGSGFCR